MSVSTFKTAIVLYITIHRHFEWQYTLIYIIGKLDIFPLMYVTDKVCWITELTLIHKNIRSVCHWHISQPDIKHIMTSLIKTITSVLKALTGIYHKYSTSSYWICCDTGDNVCLDLQNCHCSIYHNSRSIRILNGSTL
jgi:hypothetical protein